MTETTADTVSEEDLKPFRARIDEIDNTLVHLFNQRAEAANEIGRIKKLLKQPIYVPEREKEVLEHVMDVNAGPLGPAAIRRIFERIIDETRALERQKYQKLS